MQFRHGNASAHITRSLSPPSPDSCSLPVLRPPCPQTLASRGNRPPKHAHSATLRALVPASTSESLLPGRSQLRQKMNCPSRWLHYFAFWSTAHDKILFSSPGVRQQTERHRESIGPPAPPDSIFAMAEDIQAEAEAEAGPFESLGVSPRVWTRGGKTKHSNQDHSLIFFTNALSAHGCRTLRLKPAEGGRRR